MQSAHTKYETYTTARLITRSLEYIPVPNNWQVSWLRHQHTYATFPTYVSGCKTATHRHSINTVTRSYRIHTCFPFNHFYIYDTSGTNYFSIEFFVFQCITGFCLLQAYSCAKYCFSIVNSSGCTECGIALVVIFSIHSSKSIQSASDTSSSCSFKSETSTSFHII